MQKNGTFKRLTNETRKALHDRLSPSINENERHAVRCLIFTENRDKRYSLLWCAYGNKLKIFNTKTWICDPNDLSFPSIITCMCLDASNKLWVGCIDGQLFIVDTIQRICGKQLALIEGLGGCQTMAFDIVRNQMLIASRSGLVSIWNTINKQRLNNINLDEIYRNISKMQQKIYRTEMLLNLRSPTQEPNMSIFSSSTDTRERISTIPNELKYIQIYEDLLFTGYRDDYILIFRISNSNTYVYEQIVSVKYQDHSIPINSFLIYNEQLWISASYIIYVFKINSTKTKKSYDLIMKNHLDDDHLLTMLGVSGYIWAGSSRGNVYIFRMDNYELLKTFDGHKDGVCCLCPMLDTYIISGSQQYDTSIVIWENIETNDIVTTTRF
jgi:WD40 repeat protein